jgi:ribosomal protein L19
MTTFQNKCLCAFRDIKLKQGFNATIVVRNNIAGVLVEKDLFYTLAAIMDPINRLINSPRPSKSV